MARKFDLTKANLTKKLARFADVANFSNCVEVPLAHELSDFPLKGKWASNHFNNSQPITLELACGKGEYSVGQAQLYPHRNFIGVDIKGNRIWIGAKKALAEGLGNVAFLRTRIDHIHNLFIKAEVDEIWIIFPDPQPQQNRERNRLTSPTFLDRYRQILKPGGVIHLKTDDLPFFQFTQEVVAELGLSILCESNDVYSDLEVGENEFLMSRERELRIQTYYEGRWLKEGRKINYIAFEL